MNPRDLLSTSHPIADVQSSADDRHLPIEAVGVKGVRHPLVVRTAHGPQPTVATFSMDVALPADRKGTHMSRFIALLGETREAIDARGFGELLEKMLARLGADAGRIEARFAYFVEKTAPVSGVTSLLDVEVAFAAARVAGGATRRSIEVVVPVTSLCPCSKEIADYGAHNQRSHVTIRADLASSEVDVEELVRVAEESASAELYGLLKRVDEKHVTESAYDNPKFVEDLVRDVVGRLRRDARIASFVVEVENFESIHNHSAWARISSASLPPVDQ